MNKGAGEQAHEVKIVCQVITRGRLILNPVSCLLKGLEQNNLCLWNFSFLVRH